MGMKSFYPKINWVKWKSRIRESIESLIKWEFEKTVNKSWQNRWETTQIIIKYRVILGNTWVRGWVGFIT